MLINLYVKNFAIIEQINIQFNSGLNILSGETGSGKSLLIKALSLLLGNKFSKDYLGNFSESTIVEAVFLSNEDVNNLLEDKGIDADENIILTREFTNSSSITKINNRATNLKFMSEIAQMLFDIHGQHSQLVILNKSNYYSIIDDFDDDTISIKKEIKENLNNIEKIKQEINELDLDEDEIEREKDILSYQISEIEKFNFDEYDEKQLNLEYKKLSNQAELISGTNAITEFLTESDRCMSFKEMSQKLYDLILDLKHYDESLDYLVSDAINIKELISDFSREIQNYSYSLDVDEERIHIIEDIFSEFQTLKLKYGKTPEDILEFLKTSENRYNTLINIKEKIENLKSDLNFYNDKNLKLANKLTSLRKKIIDDLEKKVIIELEEMNMKNINFKISMSKTENITINGHDTIDFLISTNKGQDLKSLSDVSSGGEISRFMLALKASLIKTQNTSTIIFDEIDTGISGKTADVVGNKLLKISKNTQLIVISHLAQIASKGNYHYLISKNDLDGKTKTKIVSIKDNDRIKEIARLISGSDITENSIKSASELLRSKND